MTVRLSRRSVTRLVMDLVAGELSRSRGRSTAELGRHQWTEATRLNEDGLDLDSLERLDAASALNEFFHLHVHGAEDYLLALASLGEWCDLVEQSLGAGGEHLTFRTSGSTGAPKRCTHTLADLDAEAQGWAEELNTARTLIALVPGHHIYGLIFTALLPDLLGLAVDDATGAEAVRRARPGTLVVGTPTHWAYLARSMLAFPPELTGVTSTAPMPQHLAHQLRGQRLARLVEVYGSSETAGVAHRDREDAALTLLPRWRRAGDVEIGCEGGRTVALPDRVQWLDERRFVLGGRRDDAIQVGGINVFPARVRDLLLAHAGVTDAAVRLEEGTGRLKAFVVPSQGANDDRLLDELDRWCGARLSSVERPRRFTFGATLPRNGLGKLADW